MSADELIELARRGDLNAFNDLVIAYQDRVYNQAYRLMGDPQLAEDASQQAFLTAFQKLSQFRDGSFLAWLLRIVTNLCLDELRREKRRKIISLTPLDEDGEEIETPRWLADPGLSPEEAVERQELKEALQRGLDRLPEDFRTAVILVDLQGLDYNQAAAVMGTAVGTIKSRVARGRMKLLQAWKEAEYRPARSRIPTPARQPQFAFQYS